MKYKGLLSPTKKRLMYKANQETSRHLAPLVADPQRWNSNARQNRSNLTKALALSAFAKHLYQMALPLKKKQHVFFLSAKKRAQDMKACS